MRLWTFQDIGAYDALTKDGVLCADPKYISDDDVFLPAYNWMSEQMTKRIGSPPDGVKYPIWAWYRIRCEHKKPDAESEYSDLEDEIDEFEGAMPDDDSPEYPAAVEEFDRMRERLYELEDLIDELEDEISERENEDE